jgi:predicted metalloprotease with PDZ domain
MKIEYHVTPDHLLEHRADIRMRLTEITQPTIELVLPSWVPGSYWIQNQARFLRRLTAREPQRGTDLPIDRVDKARWKIPSEGISAIDVQFQVYGHDMRTEAVDVTSEHLFLNGGLCFPFVAGHVNLASEVVLHLPSGWKVFTELREVDKTPPRYRAENYDLLVDSPVDCGTPVELTAHARGIPHRIVLCGHGGNYEAHRLEADVGKVAEAAMRLFEDRPLAHYTFFLHLNDVPDGGLEHLTSASCVIQPTAFKPESSYLRLLALLSHEYFHLFNVKRIRPQVLGPFDYTQENYTRLLWLMEGTTDYYGGLLLRRAGLATLKRYLEKLAEHVQEYLVTPGRSQVTLEEASFQSWIDHYLPFEDSRNQSINYYLKGALVSMCLDFEVRQRSDNRRSLDDVMRFLWTQYGKAGRGIGEDEVPAIVEKATGIQLDEFFRRYVSGTEEIDFARSFRSAGLKFEAKEKKPEPDEDGEPGYLGIEIANQDQRVRVKVVLDGSPARRAGLSPRDEIIALNGIRITFSEFEKALRRYPPGSTVEISLFRRGWLTTVSVVTGKPPPEKYLLTPLENPSPLEKAIYESWLEANWEPPKKTEEGSQPEPGFPETVRPL